MPCLNPLTVQNPTFRSEKQNERRLTLRDVNEEEYLREISNTPLFLSVPCGRCVGCRKARANSWRTRLLHEFQHSTGRNLFVTLTFDESSYALLKSGKMRVEDYIRRFRDNMRKAFPSSFLDVPVKSWFITELGEDTGRFHLHGIIFNAPFFVSRCLFPASSIRRMNVYLRRFWRAGNTWIGDFSDERTASYVTKYITKLPKKDLSLRYEQDFGVSFTPRVFTSPGIGRYTADYYRAEIRASKPGGSSVLCNAGRYTVPVPRYYVKRAFSESEARERRIVACEAVYEYFLRNGEIRPLRLYGSVYRSLEDYSEALRRLYQDSIACGVDEPCKTDFTLLAPDLSFEKFLTNGPLQRCHFEQTATARSS